MLICGPVPLGLRHYLPHGASEGRDPSPRFNVSIFLPNPSVKLDGINPLLHHLAE